MSPESILEDLRRRHGVSEAFAHRFLPLVRRSLTTSPDVRERILDLVERSFARHSEREREAAGLVREVDEALLGRVAEILHRWHPAPWLSSWGEPGGR